MGGGLSKGDLMENCHSIDIAAKGSRVDVLMSGRRRKITIVPLFRGKIKMNAIVTRG